VSTTDGPSQSLPVRVALLALTGLAALQAVYFVLAAQGPNRLVALVLGLGSILIRSWPAADRRGPLAAQAVLAIAICGNLASHYPKLGVPIEWRVLLVAILLGYLGLFVAGVAALVRRSLFLPVLLSMVSFGLAVLVAEVLLERPWQREESAGPDVSWRGLLRHPDTSLPDFYMPGSQVIHPYATDPRGYFERLDPSEIRWSLTLSAPGAGATLVRRPDRPEVLRIEISSAPTRTAWHIQLTEPGFSVRRGQRLEARFRARADRPRSISVVLTQGRPPWTNLGIKDTIALDTAWRAFHLPFVATATYPWSRLQFELGAETPSVELSGVTMVDLPSHDTVTPNWPRYSVRYSFNDMGCRDRNYPLKRAPGTWRILALGDSYTLGVGVHARDVFTARLERLLNDSRGPGSPTYEVINCGVSGYSTEDALILYQRHAARYDPDVVLLTMVWNDDRSFSDEVGLRFQEQPRHRLFRTWRLLDQTWTERGLRHHDYSTVTRALEGLRQATQARGARLALVIGRNGPRREWDALIDAVYRSVDTQTVPVLDLWPRLRKEPSGDIQVLEKVDAHPSERAHAIMATEVEAFLGRHGLLSRSEHVHAR